MNKTYFLFFIFYFILGVAFAQDQIQPVKVKNSRRLKLDFENEHIKGSVANPELDMIQTGKNFNLKKMIQIKENFIPEIESQGDAFEK